MTPATPTRYLTEWLALLVGLMTAAALIGYELQRGHAQTAATERDRLAVQARVIDDNLAQQLDGINKALAGIRLEFAQGEGERAGSTSARLKTLTDAIPGVRNMFRLGPHGEVVSS